MGTRLLKGFVSPLGLPGSSLRQIRAAGSRLGVKIQQSQVTAASRALAWQVTPRPR